jgi:AraC family transcriptional regulator, transcriptional activator of pobA
MKKIVMPFVFDEEVKSESDNKDVILFDNPVVKHLNYPVKLDVTVGIICLKGRVKGRSNMRYFKAEAPCLIVLLVAHTVTIEHLSEDFSALFIIFSRKFVDNLNIEERLPVFLGLHDKPYIPFDKKELASFKNYFKMVQTVLKETDNPFSIKIIQHITKAYFYGFGYNVSRIEQHNKEGKKSRQEELVEKFLTHVQDNFKESRNVEFYSDKLYVTPKYLSKVIKDHNGLPAKQWIENYVVFEAKALLKSTNMTIQQISDELNFPSQSFFGKYFKRSVGLSPLEYRKE